MKPIDAELSMLERMHAIRDELPAEAAEGSRIRVKGRWLINFTGHDFLGIARSAAVRAAVTEVVNEGEQWASTPPRCGGTTVHHRRLEKRLSSFLTTEDTLLLPSLQDARQSLTALFTRVEPHTRDASLPDFLCMDEYSSFTKEVLRSPAEERIHASAFPHLSVQKAAALFQSPAAAGARLRILLTDGYFSSTGGISPLDRMVAVARKWKAVTVVDETMTIGIFGRRGKGLTERDGVAGEVDLILGTLSGALGGWCGAFLSGRSSLLSLIRQMSGSYLEAPALHPAAVLTSDAALRLLARKPGLVGDLHRNVSYFRTELQALGFPIVYGEHPLVHILIDNVALAKRMLAALGRAGVLASGFWYPELPPGEARIGIAVTAVHSLKELDEVLSALEAIGKSVHLI